MADVEPDLEALANNPADLAFEPAEPQYQSDVSDIDTPTSVVKLLASHDALASTATERLVSHSTADLSTLATFDIEGPAKFRALDIDVLGNVHATSNDPSPILVRSLHVLNRAATSRLDEAFDANIDRETPSPVGVLHGIDVASPRGLTFVAQAGSFNGFVMAIPMGAELVGNSIPAAFGPGVPQTPRLRRDSGSALRLPLGVPDPASVAPFHAIAVS